MGRRTDNEMEQIHKGLEDFLQKELQLYQIEEEKKRDTIDESMIFSRPAATEEEDRRYVRRPAAPEEEARRYARRPVRTAASEAQDFGPRRSGKAGSDRVRSDRNESDRRQQDRTKRRAEKKQTEERKTKKKDSGSKKSRDSKSKNSKSKNKRSEKDESGKKKFSFRKFLLTAALLAALAVFGLYLLVGALYSKLNYVKIESVASQPMQEDGVINILLIGNDSRMNGEDGRSDAMILLSVSKKTKTIYMTSLLRDMYVEIPGHGGNRLNAAYSYGGAELLMETIEQNFDISVNRYMLVNFEAFANLVESTGGVDLELTREEIEYVNGYLVEYNMLTNRPQGTDNMDPAQEGMVHLNGPQALAYCRNRYIGTDFGRTERQRKVLTEVIKKLPKALLTNSGSLLDGLLPNLTTNLTKNECFLLSLSGMRYLTYDIVSDSIPQPGTYTGAVIRKMDVLQVDFEANIKYLKEKLYGEK